jgi:hypothetical protein
VKGSVHRVVHVEDGVCTTLELLPILPKEETAAILVEALRERGFDASGSIARRIEEDGVSLEIDPLTGAVSLKAEASSRIAVDKERTERVYEETLEAGTEAARKRIEHEAEQAAAEAERDAQAEVRRVLERRLADVRAELDTIATTVAAEALKKKARTLGEIEELHENVETGELTIRVRL